MKYVLLTATVLAFFAFGYFLMDRIDRFLCENQIQNEESDSKSSQILLSPDLTDDEILKEIHGFKKNHSKTGILLYDENMNTFY